MAWIGLHFKCPENFKEILLAELSQLPFSSFEETNEGISAFCDQLDWNEKDILFIESKYNSCSYTYSKIEKTNWNKEWEKKYDPTTISDQCVVRAVFHEPTSARYEIIITPKMSFGTGHHPTTHLVLDYQLALDHTNKKIVDVGCGTGILAIMASIRGASSVLAFDIEEWCVENSYENSTLNSCANIEIAQMEISEVNQVDFDIILGNITKTIHLDQMEDYNRILNKNGLLVMSGFYQRDTDDLIMAAEQQGFEFVETKTRNNWARLVCCKQ